MPTDDEIEEWLKTIKGRTCYTERLKIYAPTCEGKCLDAVEELIVTINKLFRGSTVYDAKGSWLEGGRLVVEPVKVIEAGHKCIDDHESAKRFARAISKYATRAKQSQIAISQANFYLGDTPEIVAAFKEKFRKKR